MPQRIDGNNVRHHVVGDENYINVHSNPLTSGRVSVGLTTRDTPEDSFQDTILYLPLKQAQELLTKLAVSVAIQEREVALQELAALNV